MKRIATPMVGGIVTSTLMELLAYPAIYYLWRSRELRPPRRCGGRAARRDPRVTSVSRFEFRAKT
jgi:hypothetical protein